MTETQKRIAAYKEALPGLKERVAAVALLLVMSMAMMTSATFAWMTISLRPEVTGANTTIAANGNLEIALATGSTTAEKKTEPQVSQVGDSSAAEGQSVVGSNVTWGNLINLSDPSYGLDNLVLRPAQLNLVSLLDSPLFGALYGTDGRITQLSSNFAYTSWVEATEEKPAYFGIAENYGVRAISSTKVEAVGAGAIYLKKVAEAESLNLAAGSAYTSIAGNSTYMQSLATMMGKYMTDRMNTGNKYDNPDCDPKDIQNLALMYEQLLGAFDLEAQAMASLVNLQLWLKHGDGGYDPYTVEDIYAATNASLAADGVQISDIAQFKSDRNIIASDVEVLKELGSSGGTLKWEDSGLNDVVNRLVNVGECEMGDGTKIKNIGASNASGYMNGTQEAIITNGVLYNFEKRTGVYLDVKGLTITASVYRTLGSIPIDMKDQEVKANVHTSASDLGYTLFNNDLKYTKSQNTGDYKGGVETAMDTYGLAVDFWVRTNADYSYLTLEGNILTTSEQVRATGQNAQGAEVELFVVEISGIDDTGNTISHKVDVYKGTRTIINDEGQEEVVDAWYKADSHALLTDEELGGKTPVGKYTEIVTVVGYEGENRVWDAENKTYLTTSASTQGSGSCYVYYTDSPEDQARSLVLLESFKVAFVGADGRLKATAVMDTEHYYADDGGRVTVPLILSPSGSTVVGTDDQGNDIYGIIPLEKNVPTFLTAIVYLDGTKLDNDQVLAASDIQGRLNIQFGSTQNLTAIDNEELEAKEIHVNATVEGTEFDFDTHQGDMVSTVRINTSGSTPSTVTAFFTRSISATQGSREKEMIFTDEDKDGVWEATYTFTGPGEYILRTVELDGIPYDLDDPQKVTISGFAISRITVREANSNNHIYVMSALNYSPVNVELAFKSSDRSKMPDSVQARFLRDSDGTAVNINLTYNPTTSTWSGSGDFVASGKYTMKYVVLDGQYVELSGPTYDEDTGEVISTGQWYTADITLGMRVAVYTTSPQSFLYEGENMVDNKKLLKMQVEIKDNSGNVMEGLSDVQLNYGLETGANEFKKMHAVLTWTGRYYEGEFRTTETGAGPGIWVFKNVIANGNTLTMATTFPRFTIASPNPPEYYIHRTESYQYAPDNNAVMTADITNSEASTVRAYIQKSTRTRSGETEGVWVTGIMGSQLKTPAGETYNQWSFPVPMLNTNGEFVTANGYQDGNWHLTKLQISNVFDDEYNYYSDENPMEIVLYDAENPANSLAPDNITKVVVRAFTEFATDKSAAFGREGNKADGAVNGQFMAGYDISGLQVTIQDFEGMKIEGINTVQLHYVYGNNSKTYGGYEGTNGTTINNALADFTIDFENPSGDGITFVQKGTYTLRYAGTYTPEFRFNIDQKTTTLTGANLPARTPSFSINSVAPSVKITEIAPTGTFAVDTSNSTVADTCQTESTGSGLSKKYRAYWVRNSAHLVAESNTQYIPSINATGTEATVFYECTHEATSSSYGYTGYYSVLALGGEIAAKAAAVNDEKYHDYVQPSVSITIYNMGNAAEANLSFGTGALVFESKGGSSSTTTPYTWTKGDDTEVTRYIGIWGSSGENDTKQPAGTITATELVLNFDSNGDGTAEQFKVTVSIKIVNEK